MKLRLDDSDLRASICMFLVTLNKTEYSLPASERRRVKRTDELIEVISLKPTDRFGHDLCLGDRVRLVQLPDNISALPRNMQRLFRKVLGKTSKIKAFGKRGHAELHVSQKAVFFDTIWVEPACLELSLYSAKKSGTFGSNRYVANT